MRGLEVRVAGTAEQIGHVLDGAGVSGAAATITPMTIGAATGDLGLRERPVCKVWVSQVELLAVLDAAGLTILA